MDARTFLLELDPANKKGEEGYKRACRFVKYLRQSMKPLVDVKRAEENRKYLFGLQDTKQVERLFKDPKNCGLKFLQYSVMQKVLNVITEEVEFEGINIRLESTDAAAINERDKDMELLGSRGWAEPLFTQVNKQMGLPPFNIMSQKEHFAGNVQDFDKMGLDASDDEDLDNFYATYYRLNHEIAGEIVINYFLEKEEVSEMLSSWVIDIMAVNAHACMTYISDTTGAPEIKYLAPEEVLVMRGQKRDFKDATALGYEKTISIMSLIKMLGNDFDFEKDYDILMRAINFQGKTNYTGLLDGDRLYWGEKGSFSSSNMMYGDFLKYYLNIGYICWKEIEASSHFEGTHPTTGKFVFKPVRYDAVPRANSFLKKDSRYYEKTYHAYYLDFGVTDPHLFKYGPLSFQPVEGLEDEYSGFPIIINQQYGKSCVEIAIPFLDLHAKIMAKTEFIINKAKAPGRMWSYESLVTIAKSLYPKDTPDKQLVKIMSLFTEMSNEIYAIPTVNGAAVGGGGQMNYDLPHGIPPSVVQFQQLADWLVNGIFDQLGISPLRQSQQPTEKDGLGLSLQANSYSEKATAFLPRMIYKMSKNIGIRTLIHVQRIVDFKDRATLSYKYLLKALGDRNVQEIEHLENTSFHRYNILVQGFVTAGEKREKKDMLRQALAKGEIDYAQYLLIDNLKSYKEALKALSYEKSKLQKQKMKDMQAAQQGQAALEAQKHKNAMELATLVGEYDVKKENQKGYWLAQAHQITADSTSKDVQRKTEGQVEQIKAKEDSEIATDISKAAIQQTAPANGPEAAPEGAPPPAQ